MTFDGFNFPYTDFKFPGQHTQEKILFVTRESGKILLTKLILLFIAFGFLLFIGEFVLSLISSFVGSDFNYSYFLFLWFLTCFGFLVVAGWWVVTLWRKSIFIVTTRRLTKIIYTTPWNKYNLSLNLDKIVDGGAYKKGLFQSLMGLGYFVARSSAGNIKNFKIINIDYKVAEDLHNYITKLLYTFNNQKEKLDNFRLFMPYLKGEARRRAAPEYYQDQA